MRTDRESVLRAGLFSNPPLIAAGLLGLCFVAAISYVPTLQGAFHTAPLRLSDWLMLVGFGVVLLAADEARKAWHRRTDRARQEARSKPGRAQLDWPGKEG